FSCIKLDEIRKWLKRLKVVSDETKVVIV
ncbi:hypothetical protein LCGC14_3142100, partial [marine sediment metagenome]